MDYLFLILLLLSPLLLLITYLILGSRKDFWKIFIIHSCVLISYLSITVFFSKLLIGHDEYGLKQLGLIIILVVFHIIIGFIHSIYSLKNKE